MEKTKEKINEKKEKIGKLKKKVILKKKTKKRGKVSKKKKEKSTMDYCWSTVLLGLEKQWFPHTL